MTDEEYSQKEEAILIRLGVINAILMDAANAYSSSVRGLPEEKVALIAEREALRDKFIAERNRSATP